MEPHACDHARGGSRGSRRREAGLVNATRVAIVGQAVAPLAFEHHGRSGQERVRARFARPLSPSFGKALREKPSFGHSRPPRDTLAGKPFFPPFPSPPRWLVIVSKNLSVWTGLVADAVKATSSTRRVRV